MTQEPQKEPQAIKVESSVDADAVEFKSYVPRPELAAAGLDARRAGEELRYKQANTRQRTPTELGLECKSCNSIFIQTTHTSPKLGVVRRRKRCMKCGFAWFTIEKSEVDEDTNSTKDE